MSKKLQNATNLYLRGIRDGAIDEVLNNYMGKTYRQHSTGVSDGKEGFKAFFTDFFKRNPERDIQVVRAFEDGEYVFMHVYQNLNHGGAKWITTDIFHADEEGRIIEHWDVIDAFYQDDEIFGSFEIKDEKLTESNKSVVRTYLTEVMQNHKLETFNQYVADEMKEHDLSISNYVSWIKEHYVNYDFVFKVLGAGNYVVAYSKVAIDHKDYALFDIFRLDQGKIVEHWMNKEIMPAYAELTNSGKF
ncbi:nuclear transport factor 2 family protein [Sharpea azabuensis]|uniref:nuclear transport factor 2 family protein n=1 Tax=Sharpea azabuensis TaxID=322505 RepID=UPI0013D9A342|nr:ester cyclase [Sharpea azabuensis]